MYACMYLCYTSIDACMLYACMYVLFTCYHVLLVLLLQLARAAPARLYFIYDMLCDIIIIIIIIMLCYVMLCYVIIIMIIYDMLCDITIILIIIIIIIVIIMLCYLLSLLFTICYAPRPALRGGGVLRSEAYEKGRIKKQQI